MRRRLLDTRSAGKAIQRQSARPGSLRWRIADNLEQKFDEGLRLLFADVRLIALGRAFENLVSK